MPSVDSPHEAATAFWPYRVRGTRECRPCSRSKPIRPRLHLNMAVDDAIVALEPPGVSSHRSRGALAPEAFPRHRVHLDARAGARSLLRFYGLR